MTPCVFQGLSGTVKDSVGHPHNTSRFKNHTMIQETAAYAGLTRMRSSLNCDMCARASQRGALCNGSAENLCRMQTGHAEAHWKGGPQHAHTTWSSLKRLTSKRH
eukprot:1160118-Pelagomonas_calceolata.AAC.15